MVELDSLRREYRWTVNAYEDLYQWYQDEHGIYPLYTNMPKRLDELQVDSMRKGQLMYSIGQMSKESSTSYPMPYPLSNEQELCINRWKFRHCFKYDLITKMPDGGEKDKEEKKFCWSIETDCFSRVFGDEVWEYLEGMVMDSYQDQVVIKKKKVLAVKKKKMNLKKRKMRT